MTSFFKSPEDRLSVLSGSAPSAGKKKKRKFFARCYSSFYLLGMFVIRRWRRWKRRASRGYNAVASVVETRLRKVLGAAYKGLRIIGDDLVQPFLKVGMFFRNFGRYLRNAYYAGGILFVVRQFFSLIFRGVKRNFYLLKKLLNYLVPIGCLVGLWLLVGYFTSLSLVLEVEYQGESIAYIKDESVFENAQKLLNELVIYNEEDFDEIQVVPTYSLAIADPSQLSTESELCDRLLMASGGQITQASGLYIDEHFYGATDQGVQLQELLVDILGEYRDEETVTVQFVKDVEVRSGMYPVDSLVDFDQLEEVVTGNSVSYYTVMEGDTLASIAEKNGISVSELEAFNEDEEIQLVPGEQIAVSAKTKYLQVEIHRTIVYEEVEKYKTVQISDPSQNRGYTKVQVPGVNGVTRVTAEAVYIDDEEVSREVISRSVISRATDEQVIVGTNMPDTFVGTAADAASSIGTGVFGWPVDSGYISCGLWGYSGHRGVDIASKRGTAVRAADSGVVIWSGPDPNWGYGNYIIIDHGYGVQTLYAHNSYLYVETGQVVAKGELIAAMGDTGNASGPHLHIELRINNQICDFLEYAYQAYR